MRRAIRFGAFELDQEAGQLRKRGVLLKLRRQSVEVLAALVQVPGRLVTRDQLQSLLWPGVRYADFTGGLNSAINRLRQVLGDSAAKPKYIETVPGRGYRFIGPEAQADVTSGRKLRLAVLPLQNLTGDPGQEYLADGITEELITTLAMGLDAKRVVVIARTSCMRYKASAKPVSEIGRELAADYILEGSVQREDSRVRVTAQLIRADDETHTWAQTLDGELHSVLALEDRVAHGIAQELETKLAVPSARPPDAAAWECWLKGLYHLNVHDRSGIGTSVEYFEKGIAIDPEFARCWAKLAEALAEQAFWGYASARERLPKAKLYGLRALDLDDRLSEAHLALGVVAWHHDWDLECAASRFERALDLAPNNVPVLSWSGVFHASMCGEFDRGIAEAERALELDPLSVVACASAAWPSFWGRRYDRAIALAHRALDMEAHALLARYVLAMATLASGRIAEAVALLEETQAERRDPVSLAYLGAAAARAGDRTRAAGIARMLEAWPERDVVRPSVFVWIWANAGEKGLALDWMERAIAERDSFILWARFSPVFDPLRSERRFRDLLGRLPLPPRVRPASARQDPSRTHASRTGSR